MDAKTRTNISIEQIPRYIFQDIREKEKEGYRVSTYSGYEEKDEAENTTEKYFHLTYFDAGAPFSNFMYVSNFKEVENGDGNSSKVTLETYYFCIEIMRAEMEIAEEKHRKYWKECDGQ